MFMSSNKKSMPSNRETFSVVFFGTMGCLCRCEGKKTEIGAPQNVVRTKEPRLTVKTGRRHKGEREVANSTGRRQAFECVKNSCVSPHNRRNMETNERRIGGS